MTVHESSWRWCPQCRCEGMATRTGDGWQCDSRGHEWPFQFDGMLKAAILAITRQAADGHSCGDCCADDIGVRVRAGINRFLDESV